MKIAVCVSGAYKSGYPGSGNLVFYNTLRKRKFPTADFFYATWNTYKSQFDLGKENCFFFEEPQINYHPYLDIPNPITPFVLKTTEWIKKTRKEEWSSHHTKQILIHSLLLQSIPDYLSYDIIVRTRFDAVISDKADFTPYIEDSFVKNRANGFSVTRKEFFDDLYDSNLETYPQSKYWMHDQLIIHPPKLFDIDLVQKLHKNKELHAAEYGWYQILSLPHGGTHCNHHGWVNHDKNVRPEFLEKLFRDK
jgi:hypothetical protein